MPMWCAWQLAVPTIGLTSEDHRQPGSNVVRAMTMPPTVNNSNRPLGKTRVSSGVSRFLTRTAVIAVSEWRTRAHGSWVQGTELRRPNRMGSNRHPGGTLPYGDVPGLDGSAR